MGAGKTVTAVGSLLYGIYKQKDKFVLYLVPSSALKNLQYTKIKRAIVDVFEESSPFIIPLEDYLRQTHIKRGNLIVITTPEKFMAEYYRLKLQKDFYGKRKISVVVVDEAHTMGDENRGGKLEILLRQLMHEQKSQFIFISATFPNIRDWTDDFNLETVPKYMPDRKVIRRLRIADSPQQKVSFLKDDLNTYFSKSMYNASENQPKIALIFCATRKQADTLAKLAEEWGYKSFAIHAYKNREAVSLKLNKLPMSAKNKKIVIFSTTLLMPGIDLSGISLIVFFDFNKPYFTGIRLLQGEGRSREKEVNVILYVVRQYNERNWSDIKRRLENKLIFDSAGTIKNYRVAPVTSQIRDVDVLRAIMSYVAVTKKTKTEIKKYLVDLGLERYIDKLDNFLSNNLLFKKANRICLTDFGLKILLTSLNPEKSSILANTQWKKASPYQKFISLYKIAIGDIPIRVSSLIYDLFYTKINHKNFPEIAREHGIEEGIVTGLQRQLAWIATALFIIVEEKEKEIIKQVYDVVRTYPSRSFVPRYKRRNSKKRNYSNIIEQLRFVLNNYESYIPVKELSELTNLEESVVRIALKKMYYSGEVAFNEVSLSSRGRPIKMYFLKDKKYSKHLQNKCGSCIFKTKILREIGKETICSLKNKRITSNSLACEFFTENPRKQYFIIEWPHKECVVCNKPMEKTDFICKNCGTVYVPLKSGKYRVFVGTSDLKREKIKELKVQKSMSVKISDYLELSNFSIPAIVLHVFATDTLKIKQNKLLIRREGKKKAESIDLRLLKRIIFHGSVKLDDRTKKILEYFGVTMAFSDGINMRVQNVLRDKLKELDLTSPRILRTTISKVIAETVSNIVLIKQIKDMSEIDVKENKFIEASLSNVIELLFRYINHDATIRTVMAYEGNIKRIFWVFLRYYARKEKIYGVTARVYSRFSSRFKGGARTPFHTTLNYFYYLLSRRVRKYFADAGFSYYGAGPGILHRRGNYSVYKQEGFLFDFIDVYRAILLEKTLSIWKEKMIDRRKHFALIKIPDYGSIYYLTSEAKKILQQQFDNVLNAKIYHWFGIKSIDNILACDVSNLKSWLLKQSNYPYFIYIPSEKRLKELDDMLRPLESVFYNITPWKNVYRLLKQTITYIQ